MSLALPNSALGSRKQSPPHRRRTATAVLAGDFDEKPSRDVLTSVLNGVPVYAVVEQSSEELRKEATLLANMSKTESAGLPHNAHSSTSVLPQLAAPRPSAATNLGAAFLASRQSSGTPRPVSFAHNANGRPAIHMATAQRSVSVTPPPPINPPSPMTTPEPSVSSSRSRASSKRPRTPEDDEMLSAQPGCSASPSARPAKKPRASARKGWKGWIEGSPPPSDRLINLDHVVVITSRRTRSGRNFDS